MNYNKLFSIRNVYDAKIISDLLGLPLNLIPIDKSGQCVIDGTVRPIPEVYSLKTVKGLLSIYPHKQHRKMAL